MKRYSILLLLLSILLYTNSSYAGCFDSVQNATVVHSKIRGFFVTSKKSANENTKHYVILDKKTCVSGGGNALGRSTKRYYYLYFNEYDKFLQSSLLSAYMKGELVEFRLVGANSDGYNKIGYVIIPSGARAQ